MVQQMSSTGAQINRADFQLITRGYGPIGAPTKTLDEALAEEMAMMAKPSEPAPEGPWSCSSWFKVWPFFVLRRAGRRWRGSSRRCHVQSARFWRVQGLDAPGRRQPPQHGLTRAVSFYSSSYGYHAGMMSSSCISSGCRYDCQFIILRYHSGLWGF